MALRDLIPWNNGSRNMSLQRNEGDPFLVMHRAMNRLFDDAFRSFDVGAFGSQAIGWPSVEVSETEFTTRHAAPAEPSRLQEVIDALLDVEEPMTEDPFHHVDRKAG